MTVREKNANGKLIEAVGIAKELQEDLNAQIFALLDLRSQKERQINRAFDSALQGELILLRGLN